MIMSCSSFSSSSTSHLESSLFLNKGLRKALPSTHVTITRAHKPRFTISNWRMPSTSSKGPGENERSLEVHLLNNAFFCLERKVSRGYAPDPVQSTELLYDLCRANKFSKAIRTLKLTAEATGRPPDGPVLTYLIGHLCKRGHFRQAKHLIENFFFQGFGKKWNLSHSLQLVERMVQQGLEPNEFTITFLVETVCRECGVYEAERLAEEIVAKGGRLTLTSYNVLLRGFCNRRKLDDAMRLFRSLPAKGFRPSIVSYNILLRYLSYGGRFADANELLAEMGGSRCSPNAVTYSNLVGSLAKHGHAAHALQVLDEMARNGFRPKVADYNRIIARLCKEGDVAAAKCCLDSMIQRQVTPNVGTYLSVSLMCFCEKSPGLVHEAFDILRTLYNHHQQDCPTHDFYRDLVSHLCQGGKTFAAFKLLPEMVQEGFTPDSYTYSSLIHGLCCEGMLDEVLEVMGVIEEDGLVTETGTCFWPAVDLYNQLVLTFCKSERTDLALEVYARMVERGWMPNETTYSILVGGIARDDSKLAAEVLMELYRRNSLMETTVEMIAMQNDLKLLNRHASVGNDFMNTSLVDQLRLAIVNTPGQKTLTEQSKYEIPTNNMQAD